MTKRSLAILLALLVVARASLVLSLSDVFFYGEELGKGAAAKAMLDGLGVEHYQLSYGYHEGGGFVVTHLKALAFLLVGESVLANKLVALFTTSLLLVVGCWFTSEHFGRRAGWIFGLLFVFCPAAFQRCSLLDLGTHFEAMIFITLILHFTFRVAFAAGERDSRSGTGGLSRVTLDSIGLGLSAGFGIYFSLQCAPAIACAALCLIAAKRRAIFGRSTVVALAAFAVGALPLWWMMSHVGLSAVIVRGHALGQGTSVAQGARDLFEPLRLHGTALDWVAFALQPVVIGLGMMLLWRSARAEARASADSHPAQAAHVAAGEVPDLLVMNRKALVVLGYLVLFVVLYLTSGLAVSVRGHWFFFLRLSAVWFMGIVLFAAVSNAWAARATPLLRTGYAGAFGLLLIAGLFDFMAVMHEGRPRTMSANARLVATTKGYNYSEYLDKFVHHLDLSEEATIGVLRRYRDDPDLLWPSIDHSLFEHSKLALEEVLAISRRAYGENWIVSLKGLGPYLRTSNGYDLQAEFAAVAQAPPETQQALAEAVGRTGLGLMIFPERIEKEIQAPVPDPWRRAFLRGTGWRIHQISRLHPERALDFIGRQKAEDQVALREGFEAAVALNTLM